jgi:hypothetical protein
VGGGEEEEWVVGVAAWDGVAVGEGWLAGWSLLASVYDRLEFMYVTKRHYEQLFRCLGLGGNRTT